MFNLPMTLSEQNSTKKQPVGATASVCMDAEGGWGTQWAGIHSNTTTLQPSHSDRHGTSKRQPFSKGPLTATNKSCQSRTLEAVSHFWYLKQKISTSRRVCTKRSKIIFHAAVFMTQKMQQGKKTTFSVLKLLCNDTQLTRHSDWVISMIWTKHLTKSGSDYSIC